MSKSIKRLLSTISKVSGTTLGIVLVAVVIYMLVRSQTVFPAPALQVMSQPSSPTSIVVNSVDLSAVANLPSPSGNWSTYASKSPKYRYTIEYPSGWSVLEAQNDSPTSEHLVFTSAKPPIKAGQEPPFEISLDIYPALGAQTASEWAAKVHQMDALPPKIRSSEKSLQVSGLYGTELSGLPSRSGTLDAIFIRGDASLVLSLEPYDPDASEVTRRTVGSVDVFHRMISSLRFSN